MVDKERIRKAVSEILLAIGEDPEREGLKETPDRVARMYDEIFKGNYSDPCDLAKVFNEESAKDPIVVKDIPIYSMCEHHMLPFMGLAHVAYVPRNGKILGLSKIARMVELVSNKLQLQERLTKEIANCIKDTINPLGIVVVVEAEHMCMIMRGIKKVGSKTVTISTIGDVNYELKKEIMMLIGK